MDEVERQKMLKELEDKLPGFGNPAVRISLDRVIKQCKGQEKILGRKGMQAAIDSQKMSQDQKDYIYLRMGWL